jgi:2-oxoglutarate dehydrogenase E2 component (dihydrolipoamide succinyltransferase)
MEVDFTRVARLRAEKKAAFEAGTGQKLSYMPFIMKATVDALKAFPIVNSSVAGSSVIYRRPINLGIAVALDWGLIVPVVRNADDLSLGGLSKALNDLAGRARAKKLDPREVQDGTFTITNPGVFGSLTGTPIINQPQVAILGTGALVKRPVVVADEDGGETIAVRSMMYLALSYDHRIVDGADAARFLGAMKTRLEEGRFEASLGL